MGKTATHPPTTQPVAAQRAATHPPATQPVATQPTATQPVGQIHATPQSASPSPTGRHSQKSLRYYIDDMKRLHKGFFKKFFPHDSSCEKNLSIAIIISY